MTSERRSRDEADQLAWEEPRATQKTDTEDPNIATLRTFLGYHLRGHQSAALSDARQAISALASTLAERDGRIAEETERRLHAEELALSAADKLRAALEAPPAPAPGELAKHIALVSGVLNEFRAASVVLPRDAIAALLSSAESWQRLQWRPASEAPCGRKLLVTAFDQGIAYGFQLKPGSWFVRGQAVDARYVRAWTLPENMPLPALNGGDDNG